MTRTTEELSKKIVDLYKKGLNCVQIKETLHLKGHQQVLNVLKKTDIYIPYKYGRNYSRSYTLDELYFKKIDSEEKAYFLGLICADGCVDTTRQTLRFLLQTRDKAVLERLRRCLGSNTIIKDVVRKTRFNYGKPLFYHSIIEFCSKTLVNTLLDKTIDGNKTYTLTSKVIKHIPKHLIRHFLRGYFDGDGNVMFGKYYGNGKKHSVNIAGNLEFLTNTFGKYFPTRNKYYKFPKSKQCWCYKLSSKINVTQFLEYLYKDSTVYLQRKYDVYLEAMCS